MKYAYIGIVLIFILSLNVYTVLSQVTSFPIGQNVTVGNITSTVRITYMNNTDMTRLHFTDQSPIINISGFEPINGNLIFNQEFTTGNRRWYVITDILPIILGLVNYEYVPSNSTLKLDALQNSSVILVYQAFTQTLTFIPLTIILLSVFTVIGLYFNRDRKQKEDTNVSINRIIFKLMSIGLWSMSILLLSLDMEFITVNPLTYNIITRSLAWDLEMQTVLIITYVLLIIISTLGAIREFFDARIIKI